MPGSTGMELAGKIRVPGRLRCHCGRFQAQVEFPRCANIRSADLCAILGNLLDNAIEAARQVPEPEGRTVNLTIRRIRQMLVIKVENSFAAGLSGRTAS